MFNKKNSSPSRGGSPTYLGGGMKIDGKIIARKPIWMDGKMQGSIDCESEVVIGPSAKINATIHAATIKVNGQIDGDLYAYVRMEVLSKGKIHGNITNLPGSLIIHEGGIVEGQCLTKTKQEIRKLMPNWESVETQLKKELSEKDQPASKVQQTDANNNLATSPPQKPLLNAVK